mmetsp:Transcript_5897/g.10198  ORF Transcript_5897/g.10198 Transcript_5897/m.10198 type:complete len:212 (-) Transcript_5897:166-801(-)
MVTPSPTTASWKRLGLLLQISHPSRFQRTIWRSFNHGNKFGSLLLFQTIRMSFVTVFSFPVLHANSKINIGNQRPVSEWFACQGTCGVSSIQPFHNGTPLKIDPSPVHERICKHLQRQWTNEFFRNVSLVVLFRIACCGRRIIYCFCSDVDVVVVDPVLVFAFRVLCHLERFCIACKKSLRNQEHFLLCPIKGSAYKVSLSSVRVSLHRFV